MQNFSEEQRWKFNQQKEFTRQFGQAKCERFSKKDCTLIADKIGVCGWEKETEKCTSSYKVDHSQKSHIDSDKLIRQENPQKIAFDTGIEKQFGKESFMGLLTLCKLENVSKPATIMILKFMYLSNGGGEIDDIISRARKIITCKSPNDEEDTLRLKEFETQLFEESPVPIWEMDPCTVAFQIISDVFKIGLNEMVQEWGTTPMCFAVIIYEYYYALNIKSERDLIKKDGGDDGFTAPKEVWKLLDKLIGNDRSLETSIQSNALKRFVTKLIRIDILTGGLPARKGQDQLEFERLGSMVNGLYI